MILINVDFEKSWLKEPDVGDGFCHGSWASSAQNLPCLREKNFVPRSVKNSMPSALPYEFVEGKAQRFLSAASLLSKGKIELNEAFDSFQMAVSDVSNFHVIEKMDRLALSEHSAADFILTQTLDRIEVMLSDGDID